MSDTKFHRLDFDKTIDDLTQSSVRAQCTFFYRLIMILGAQTCRTIIRYCYERLDRINNALPDNDPAKARFIELRNQHKTFLTKEEVETLDTDKQEFHLTLKDDYGQNNWYPLTENDIMT